MGINKETPEGLREKCVVLQAVSEAKEHFGFIGLFWYNDTKKNLITVKENLEKIYIPMGKVRDKEYYAIGNYAHFTTWTDKVSKDNGGVDYKYYPRGRVVYFPQSQTFKIFTDKCVPVDVLKSIKKEFLTGDKAEVVHTQGYDDKINRLAKSGHYTCHTCRGD